MNQESWVYLAQLTRALQQEGVDGARAGEFVAEIDSHLAETEADPIDEFGTPFELAAELARRPGSLRPGWLPPIWAMWIVGLVVALVLIAVLEAFTVDWDDTGVPINARGVAYIAVFYPAVMVFSYVGTRGLTGRTWTALTGSRALLVLVGIGVATATASTIAGDRVIARVPVSVFWGVTALVGPIIVFLLIKWSNPIRFPDHAKHLRRLKRGPFAGRPPAESPR